MNETKRGHTKSAATQQYFSVNDTATRLGMSPEWVWKRIYSGEIASAKFGRARRVHISAIEAFERDAAA